MKKTLSSLAFFLTLLASTYAELPPPDVVFIDSLIETFESDTSDAWILQADWMIDESNVLASAYFDIPPHGVIAAINDDVVGPNTTLGGKLISPPIVRVPGKNYILDFEAYFINGDYGGDETAKVQISTDQTNWTTILDLEGETNWQSHTLIVPPIADEDTLYLAFDYDDGNSWNYGFAVDDIAFRPAGDYVAAISNTQRPLYTQQTLKQLVPIELSFDIQNFGNLNLTDLEAVIEVETPVGIETINETIPEILEGGSDTYDFSYTPSEIGEYNFNLSFSHPEIGDNFYQDEESFILSDTLLARDDGSQESGLGFGFGDPNWYGYYGSRFELTLKDTVTAMTVYIANGSIIANSSINLTITAFDDTGEPVNEVFHTPEISLEDNIESDFSVTYQFPKELILNPGNYVFAAGQDTIQGIVGFGFDQNHVTEDGFWITSPVAGGGYPWANAVNRETLMIRPHLKSGNISTGVRTPILQEKIKVFPNPATDELTIDISQLKAPVQNMTVYNNVGQLIDSQKISGNGWQNLNLSNYPIGKYILKIQTEKGIVISEFIKK